MPAKTPIYLKAAHKKGKKFRLRDVLSPDMISPPLGDFRHTIHIGKEGQHDVFGDISFLQGNYELLPGAPEKAARGPLPGHEFFRANSTSDSALPETPSPVLKNAISLPSIGGSQALVLPLLSPVTFHARQEARASRVPPGPPRAPPPGPSADVSWASSGSASRSSQGRDSHSSSLSEQYPDWPAEDLLDPLPAPSPLGPGKTPSQTSLSDLTGSLLSLQLDLGPSLLDEVLNVMDKNK
ncbi:cdc42 effector protein 3 [Sorex fumeus]|uniref:cdc42 effector protein 3 n=1 Tax=Sorex fumeus TaxID=62283 RepID=UPI0024ADD5B7|nr:cdc42 effector protein 3 [Sorex fumeus]